MIKLIENYKELFTIISKKLIVRLVATSMISGLLVQAPVALAENVIATVGDDQITQEEFYNQMKQSSGEAVLRMMLLQKVLEQNVEKPEEIRNKVDEDIKVQIEQLDGEDVFQQYLAMQNLGSIDNFKEQLYVQSLLQDVIEQRVDMSDEALKKFYDEKYQPLMEAQHILVDSKEEADQVIARLNEGEDFDAIAQEVSQDSTAADGGYLGEFTEGMMVPEFEEAVKKLQNGEYTTEPVESQFGFHVIKALKNGEKLPFDEVKDDVKAQYIGSQFEDTDFADSIITELLEKANIDIKDDDLKDTINHILDITAQPQTLEEPPVEDTDIEAEVDGDATEDTQE